MRDGLYNLSLMIQRMPITIKSNHALQTDGGISRMIDCFIILYIMLFLHSPDTWRIHNIHRIRLNYE